VDSLGPILFALLFVAGRILFRETRKSALPDDAELSRQADAYAAQGQLPLAEETLNRLLQRAQRKNRSNSIEVGIYLRRLARVKIDQGNAAAAFPILLRVLSIQELNLGLNSPDLLQTVEWIANLSPSSSDLDATIDTTRRILASQSAAFGENSYRLAGAYNVLGLLVHMKGEAESAIFAFRRAVEVSNENVDERNLAFYLLNLGITLHQNGDSDEAEPLIRRSLSIQEKYPPTDTPNFISTLKGLGDVLVKKKDPVAAEPYYRRSFEILEKKLGPENSHLSGVLTALANTLAQ